MRKIVVSAVLFLAANGLFAQEHNRTLTDIAILYSPEEVGTEVKAGYAFRKDKNSVLLHDGDGLSQGQFDANSTIILGSGKEAVSGGVSYRRGVKKNVLWNTSSDFELLYPYIMADTVGGNLQKEQYAFYGRYAGSLSSRFDYGLSANYRALHEYRQTDPRPRNITSDFSVNAGIGLKLNGKSISMTAGYRRYHQLQAVSFVDPRGANTAELHLTGLGTQYTRFSGTGTFTNLRFRGHGFNAAAQLINPAHQGVEAGIAYECFIVTRHLINQNEVPYSELFTQDLKAFIQFHNRPGSLFYGAGLDLFYQLRQGREAIVPSIISSGVEDIPWLGLYRNRIPSEKLWGTFCLDKKWTVEPCVGAEFSEAVRRESSALMRIYGISGGATVTFNSHLGALDVKAVAGGLYTARPQGEFTLPSSTKSFLYDRYASIYQFFTENLTEAFIKVKLRHPVKNINVFIQPEATVRRWAENGRSLYACITAGIEF